MILCGITLYLLREMPGDQSPDERRLAHFLWRMAARERRESAEPREIRGIPEEGAFRTRGIDTGTEYTKRTNKRRRLHTVAKTSTKYSSTIILIL